MHHKAFVIMYAYDTVILCGNEDGVKQALVVLSVYCTEWKLKLNFNKAKLLVLSREGKNLSNYLTSLDLMVKTLLRVMK